jgi:phospholipid/cholesterol/gamma-HCH transport system substrate-binding protein
VNPHTNYVAVGLFLLFGSIALIGLVMWLGKAGDTAPTTRYVVQIDGNVNGLSNGSIVRYLGVNVGSVVDIDLHTHNMVKPVVEVWIQIQEDLPIGEATYATLVAQGVTGIANIDLANDLDTARPQEMHESGVPIIPFRPTGLSALLSGGGDLAEGVRRLVGRLNNWAGEENQRRVEEILENLRVLSESLADQSDEIPELVDSLKGTLASLERASQGLEGAVAEDWPVIAADLKTMSANLSAASGRVDGWLERNEDSVDRLLGQGLDDVAGLAADLRQVADQLNRLSARLREDPSRLIYRPAQDPVVAEP